MISQSVPGTRNVTIYPYLCKIDIMSSNSYLLSSPGQIALIDPGGVQSQIECLEEEIQILQDELPRPVVVYLTHVHIDHWYQLTQCTNIIQGLSGRTGDGSHGSGDERSPDDPFQAAGPAHVNGSRRYQTAHQPWTKPN